MTTEACPRRSYFNPHAPCGARLVLFREQINGGLFQSTRPVWGATRIRLDTLACLYISIHTPRVGRDRACGHSRSCARDFNPRAPRGARRASADQTRAAGNFNPRAPRGARRIPACGKKHRSIFQSTRPAWGATARAIVPDRSVSISIHAPRVGRDITASATRSCARNFNPRAPRGARHRCGTPTVSRLHFNPRAPRGARLLLFMFMADRVSFQSTRPAWGATRCGGRSSRPPSHFNPRAPRGARLFVVLSHIDYRAFQSTRPAWGATGRCRARRHPARISIHAPRVGRDIIKAIQATGLFGFQSTRPAWGATFYISYLRLFSQISIHAPRVGRDVVPRPVPATYLISIHAPRVGRDFIQRTKTLFFSGFQSTRPAWGATC